jgi:hypothetical protein
MTRSLLFWLLFLHPAVAQDPTMNPIGARIVPNANLVLFDTPPNDVFKSQPTAQAILQPSTDGDMLFTLQPDGTAPSGYSVTGQTLATGSPLVVTNFVDVYQDKGLNRWVQVAPLDNARSPAWVLWGEVGQSPQSFTVTTGEGN